jgi:hypothetical protein
MTGPVKGGGMDFFSGKLEESSGSKAEGLLPKQEGDADRGGDLLFDSGV